MLITFQCPGCDTNIEIEADAAGAQLECPTCKAILTVPRQGPGPGTTIGGFKIEKLLGKGGMGEVYLARQLSMDRVVALKILPGRLTLEKDTVERFLREVRMLARLDHPNIVTAHEAGEDFGIYFMAMAYVNGDPLDIKIRREGPLPEKQALRMILKIARALAYAWSEHRLIHRDVKPGNIMLDKNEEPRLMDLGLSKSLAGTTMTQSDMIVGTPNYMSPEQAEGREVDFKSDMYSLGSTLYHMLTGQVPFKGSSVVEILRKQATELLPDPRTISPEISDACVALLEIMLAKDPAQRHSDWPSLIADIDRVCSGGTPTRAPLEPGESILIKSSARDIPPGNKQKKKVPAAWKTRSAVSLAVGLLAVLLAAGIGLFLVSHRKRPAPATMDSEAEETPVATAPAVAVGQAGTERLKLEFLAGQYAEAEKYGKEHPGEYAEIRSRFERMAREGVGTEFEEKAKESLQQLGAEEQRSVDKAMEEIEKGAEDLYAKGRTGDAIESIQAYSGPFAERTKDRRQELSERFAKRAEEARETGQAKLDQLVREVAAALSRGDTAAAEAAVTAAGQDADLAPLGDELGNLRKTASAVASMPKTILASFRGVVGREVNIAFKTGPQTLRIVSVAAGEVRARRQISNAGFAERNFTVNELSLQEQFKRLGEQNTPELGILRGLLLVQARKPSAAAKYFRESGGKLGEALAARIDQRMANATEKAGPAGSPSAATTPKAAAPPRRIEPAQLAEVVKRIEKANPQVVSLASMYDVTDTDVEMDLSKNPELTDITPLKGLPLTKLNLAETKVADLDPLKGMPLSVLNLADTPLTRLSALKGLRLEKLDLTHCRVTDYRDLSELPLTELKLFWAWATDLKSLKKMPLTRLNIDGHQAMAPAMDLRPLADLPLISLSMVNTPVTDLTPLKGLPLTYLNAELCKNLKDLSPLNGLPLETLNIQNTAVDNLSPLAGMPLQMLNICSTRVSDLTPLKGMTTLTTLLMYYGEQYRILSPILENLQKGSFDAAEAGANAMADTLESVPALGSFVHLLRALAGTRIAEWKTMAGGDIKSVAKTFNGHSYAIPPVFKNLQDAQAYGRSKGAHLVTIGSKDEMDWVTSTFALPDIPVRLGGSDEKKEGTWEWLTGEPYGFSNWGDGQPDNWQGHENSIGFFADGKWGDIMAGELFLFLLEWDEQLPSAASGAESGLPAKESAVKDEASQISPRQPSAAESGLSVLFEVNMKGILAKPSSQVAVGGDAAPIGGAGFGDAHTPEPKCLMNDSGINGDRKASDGIYSRTVLFPRDAPTGIHYNYWCGDLPDANGVFGGWESGHYTNEYNRMLTLDPAQSTKTNGVEFFRGVFPQALFTRAFTVVFQADLSGIATGSTALAQVRGNYPPLAWDNTAPQLYDDGTQGDITSGDRIFSRAVTFAAGLTNSLLEYKFWAPDFSANEGWEKGYNRRHYAHPSFTGVVLRPELFRPADGP